MKKIATLIAIVFVAIGYSQLSKISGKITTSSSEGLSGASVVLSNSGGGIVSDTDGFYTIDVKAGNYTLTVSYVGYETQIKEIYITEDEYLEVDFMLIESTSQLQAIEIFGTKKRSYKSDFSNTATKVEMPVVNIPQSVSMVTKELMQDRNALRLNDIIENVAGVNTFSPADQVTIRGFFNDGSNGRLLNGMQTFFFDWTSPMLVNIERVEFVKGPASSIYGKTDPGGTVNMVTKKPLKESRKSIDVVAGSFQTIRTMLDFTGPLDDDKKFLYRLNIGYENAASFRDYVNHKTLVVAPSFSFVPSDKTKLNIDFVHTDYNSVLDRGQPLAYGDTGITSTPISFNPNQPDDYLKQKIDALTLSFQQKFSEGLTLNAAYQKFNYKQPIKTHWLDEYFDDKKRPEIMKGSYIDRVGDFKGDNFSTYLNWTFNNSRLKNTITAGFDYAGAWYRKTNRWAYVTGDPNIVLKKDEAGDYMASIERTPVEFDLKEPHVPYVKRDTENYEYKPWNYTNYGANYRTSGVYLQDVLELNKFILLLGLRQEFFTYPKTSYKWWDGYPGGSIKTTQKIQAFTPRLGLTYKMTRDINVYATYTKGFEPQEATVVANPKSGGPFKNMTSSLIEVGSKGEFFNKRLFAGLAIYQLEKNNILYKADDPNDPENNFYKKQRGQERANGFEFETTGNILPNLSVNFNYAYNKAIITKAAEGDTNEGKTKENAPRHMSGSWIKYIFNQGVLDGIGLSVGHSQVSERNTFEEKLKISGYTIFNTAVSYQVKKLRLSLNIDNIFDETYHIGGRGYDRVYPGSPRRLLLKISYAF